MTDTPILGQLLLLSTAAEAAAPYVEAAEKLRVSWVLGCQDNAGADASGTAGVKPTLRLRFDQRESALEIVQYAMEHPLAAIVAVDERCAPSAARAASMIGMRCNPPRAADVCVDKLALRQRLSNIGLMTLLGEPHAGQDLALIAILDQGKMRILGVIEEGRTRAACPRPALDALARAVRAASLRHGPLYARLRLSEGKAHVMDLSPAVPEHFASLLRFRIPLVDSNVSLPEVILRHASGMDISRICRAD